MRLQNRSYTCGPAAIANAIRALDDTEFDEDVIYELAGTTGRGTTTHQAQRAIRKLGYQCERILAYEDHAWRVLRGSLLAGEPVLMSVDGKDADDHWIVAIGMLGDRILIADSADGETVVSRDRWSVMRRWVGRKSSLCEGIVLRVRQEG